MIHINLSYSFSLAFAQFFRYMHSHAMIQQESLKTLTFPACEVINLGTSALCSQYLGAELHKKVIQVAGIPPSL